MFNPVHTYRIQFHKGFTFRDFDAIIPYLQKLGVRTIYASPLFQAVPGSMHGYDVVNPYLINPEIGTEAELLQLSKKLKSINIHWIQDIVPNHMAYHPSNIWLMDVLEKGTLSAYASFFDVTWTNPLFHGRVMAPFLDGTIEEVIERKELSLVYEHQRLGLHYFDQFYPLHPRTYRTLLQCVAEPSLEVKQLIEQLEQIPQITDPITYAFRWHEFLMQLSSQMRGDEKQFMEECIDEVNRKPEMLLQLAESQVYRLCSWKETDHRINYRRFFTVNGLICLNMQLPEVFQHYHQKVKSLLEEGVFQGLRIDHVDGLYDPQEYLHRLRELAGKDTYIVVEKILEPGELLSADFPVQGTTGYDFLGLVNNVFTRNDTERSFTAFYSSLVRDTLSTRDKIVEKKRLILQNQMQGELANLTQLFIESGFISQEQLSQLKHERIGKAIGEFLIQFPVYRYYGNQIPLPEEEQKGIAENFKTCRQHQPDLTDVLDLLEDLIRSASSPEALYFYQRCMQFTGPLMAKGVEDTLMYTFNRFVGHNEVGDSPEYFGLTVAEFHQKMLERQQSSPLTMNATSTHDTKRGEDVRTRLNVLTDLPGEWIERVKSWQLLNAKCKTDNAPDVNDEYLIYQTLTGAWPMVEEHDFVTRMEEYLVKALREAKRNSDWAAPNEKYEKATIEFVKKILEPEHSFLKNFLSFQKKVSDHGIMNSVSQVILKFTCPGVPDSYQGAASWDLSLVDPDNRRAIDFKQRELWLDQILAVTKSKTELLKEMWKERTDSRIKLWLVHTLMKLRTENAELFFEGHYIPLAISGAYQDHLVAFARRFQNKWIVIVVPLYTASLCAQQKKEIHAIQWKDTVIHLPAEAPDQWRHLLNETKGTVKKGIPVKEIFTEIPLALLQLEDPAHDRSAGVLLSITSLPSAYGIGDLGSSAHEFVSSLSRSKQTYWQLLPLNPVSAREVYSPYSTSSTQAGNILLISPEHLLKEGYLTAKQLKEYELPSGSTVHYHNVEKNKKELLEVAWLSFQRREARMRNGAFTDFINKESYWLEDYARYEVLKNQFSQQPWFEWPDQYRLRESTALVQLTNEHEQELTKIKWFQFLFHQQWSALRQHCRVSGVRLLGDLPFYVSHDSADVWSHPEIFNLDEKGMMRGVAGVPPDYFNSNGQLWGMPVFRWEVLQKQEYKWWIGRVRKNLELYDVLRFDHFRAFLDYWEVPAAESTAIHGEWKKGPGAAFFNALKQETPSLPFIAEDLGDVTQEVFDLRDQFQFPGMKILQYAFDEQMANSIFIPHHYTNNSIVYTGTHDNNTTRGWYRIETSKEQRKRVEHYLGFRVKEKTVSEALIRTAYRSVAKTVIIPMQDILNLDEEARMNTPSSLEGNWRWRMKSGQLNDVMETRLRDWTKTYGR